MLVSFAAFAYRVTLSSGSLTISVYGTQTFNYGLISVYSSSGADVLIPLTSGVPRAVTFSGGQTITNQSTTNDSSKFIVTATPITIMGYNPDFALIPSGHVTIMGNATISGYVTVATEPYITLLCSVAWFNPDAPVFTPATSVIVRLDTTTGDASFSVTVPFSLDLLAPVFSPTSGIGILTTVMTDFIGVNYGTRSLALLVQEVAHIVKTPP